MTQGHYHWSHLQNLGTPCRHQEELGDLWTSDGSLSWPLLPRQLVGQDCVWVYTGYTRPDVLDIDPCRTVSESVKVCRVRTCQNVSKRVVSERVRTCQNVSKRVVSECVRTCQNVSCQNLSKRVRMCHNVSCQNVSERVRMNICRVTPYIYIIYRSRYII